MSHDVMVHRAVHREAVGALGGSSPNPDPYYRQQKGPYTLLDIKNTPVPIKVTWARQAVSPAKLGVRKDVTLLDVIRFRAKADIVVPSGRFVYGFSARDTIFNGRFSVNVPARVVAYEKKFSLPNGTNIAASAGFQHVGGGGGSSWLALPQRRHFKPILGAQIRFGSVGDGNVVWHGDSFSLKQRVPLPLWRLGVNYPRFELETYTSVRIPQLTTRYSVHNDGLTLGTPPGFAGRGREQEEDNPLHVHVQGINAVVRL